MEIIIGCDIGTTSVKAIAIDSKGEIIATSQQEYSMHHPQPDWHEQRPEEILKATFQCLRDVLHSLAPTLPKAIVFSAAMHGLMVIDSNNQSVTPLIIWADNRSIDEADQLKDTPLGSSIYHQTGTPIHPMSPLCKLLWMQKHHSEYMSSHYKFVGIKEYILFQLTHQWITDYSIASATGLFNIHTKQWEQQCLDLLGISATQLPSPVSPTAQFQVRSSIDWLDPSIKIIPGASDGCLSNLGAGALSKGKMALTIGTSAAVRVAAPTAYTAANKSTFCYLLDDETYICGGGSNSGGKVYDWALQTLFTNQKASEVTALVSQTPITSLLFFPYLFGERAPLWNAHVKGGFYGLDITHNATHMLRAVQEGIVFNLLLISQQIEQQQSIDCIYANGGFVANAFWVQMLADIFNKPVLLNESKEAAAIGAAILGFKSLGIIQDYEQATHFHTEQARFLPNSDLHEQYQALFQLYQNRLSIILS